MGNAQSTETARRSSQKLSKPKTNNHATAGLLGPGGSSNNTKRHSSRPLPNPPSSSPSPVSTPTSSVFEQADTLQTRNSRSASFTSVPALQQESKRRSLFRVRPSQVVPDIDRRDSVGSGSRMVDRLNGTSSLTYESAIAYYGPPEPEEWSSEPRTRTSWNYNLTSYEAKRLLNLVEEPGLEHTTTMSENWMTVVTETTWKSSNPTNPPNTSITRANSDVSLYMPVRRRSIIQTPGVATRANSMRSNLVPPRLNPRYSHPPTPSLSRQQSFDSYRDGIVSLPPRIEDLDSIPRAVTPREEDYQSIGGYKLGSLRITNGAASPSSPEVEKRSGNRGLRLGGDDDYFARAETSDQSTTTSSAAAPQSHAAGLGHTTTTVVNKLTSVVSDGVSVTSSQQFLKEVSFSPLSIRPSPPTSPRLQTTSKHTALEDSLFENYVLSEFAAAEVLDVRLDPNAKSPHSAEEANPAKLLSRSDSGFMSTTSPSPESLHKPLTKADSGYSSNVSLRSFKSKDPNSKKKGMGSLEDQVLQAARRSTSIRSDDQEQTRPTYVIASQREAPPPVPPKDARHQSPGPSPNPKSARKSSGSPSNLARESSLYRANNSKAPPSLTPIKNLRSRERGPASPESVSTPVSAKSTKSNKSTSTLSIGSKPQKPNRLQRLLSSARRSAAGPLEAHVTHAVEKTIIPSIPKEVENKLREHNGKFPMTTKRPALRPRASLDTLKTIFSVGSMEASLDAINSVQKAPTSAESGTELTPKESSWRQTIHSVPTHIAHVAAQVMPKRPIVRKPLPARQSLDGRPRLVSEFALRGTGSSPPRNSHEATFDALVGGRAVIYSPADPDEDQEDARYAITQTEVLSTLPSPLLPSPLARAMSMSSKTNTPPPMSLATRRQMSLRVPPPLRSQSSNPSLRRTVSRESVQSYPAAQPLSRKPSRENIHSYPSCQQEMIPDAALPSAPPTMDPRRLSAFRQSSSRQPTWEVESEHGLSRQPSYTSLNGGSRRGSLTSVQEHEGYSIQRPSSAQPWQMQPNLRHRASYDEWNQRGRRPQSGYPPSMSNGYTALSKPVYDPRYAQHTPANTWSHSQLDAAAGQWYQNGPYAQEPRGHYRKRSMSMQNSYGPKPPYRVLHSYNSPAYRNAPIWG